MRHAAFVLAASVFAVLPAAAEEPEPVVTQSLFLGVGDFVAGNPNAPLRQDIFKGVRVTERVFGGRSNAFYAPLNLPQDAVVTGIEVVAVDKNADFDLRVFPVRITSGAVNGRRFNLFTSGSAGLQTVSDFSNSFAIDPFPYAIEVSVVKASGGSGTWPGDSSLAIKWIEVQWEMP